MSFDHARVLAELHAATDRLTGLVATATGEEPVPACPGWTVRDLTLHVGSVHRWAAAIVLSGYRDLPDPTPAVTGSLVDWYRGAADALLAVVAVIDPDEPVPNFARVRETAAFWPRRQLHETTVHGVDAAQALGLGEDDWGVTPEVAADGIEEVLGVFFPRMTARGTRPDVRGPVRLHATDLDVSWIVAPAPERDAAPVQLPPSTETDSVVHGTATDLYLGLWKRVGATRLTFDDDVARAVLEGPTVP